MQFVYSTWYFVVLKLDTLRERRTRVLGGLDECLWPVDEVQVKVIQFKVVQCHAACRLHVLRCVFTVPQFPRHEDVTATDPIPSFSVQVWEKRWRRRGGGGEVEERGGGNSGECEEECCVRVSALGEVVGRQGGGRRGARSIVRRSGSGGGVVCGSGAGEDDERVC